MRHLVAITVLLSLIAAIAYVLLSPAFLGDYRWIIIAMPISLLIAREVCEHVPAMRTPSLIRQACLMTLVPEEVIAENEQERRDEESDGQTWIDDKDEEDEDPIGPYSDLELPVLLQGFWTGSLTVWPMTRDENLRIVPVHLVFVGHQLKPLLLPVNRAANDARVTSLQVVDWDSDEGVIDLEVSIYEDGRCDHIETTLLYDQGLLISGDRESATVILELKRARLVPLSQAC